MPGLFDNASPAGGGLFSGLANMFANVGAGLSNPSAYLQQMQNQQAQQATYQALLPLVGGNADLARAAALQPEILKQIAPELNQAPKVQQVTNPLTGEPGFYATRGGVNPSVTALPVQGQGGVGQSPMPSSIFEQIQGLQQQGANRDQMLGTIPVQSGLRNAVAGMLEGGLVPSNFSMRGAAHDLAVKIASAIDPAFNEQELGSRRKMYMELNSSSPNSMGGILSNGKSAFGHLATVADRLVDLGSAAGPNMPFGGHIGSAQNYITNELAPSPETKGKLTGINEALLKYGQEATKFYAGTGGGEAERLHALKTMNPATAIKSEQAEFLKTQRDLMLERLTQKTDQIYTQLGPKAAQKAGLGAHDQENLARIDKAIAKLSGGTQQAAPAAGASSGPKQVSSKTEYDALPPGSQYTAPDGSVRTKR